MKKEEEIKQHYERLTGELNERTHRLFAANEAMALGWGGIAVVARATGLTRQVIVDGMQELREGQRVGEGRIRRIGGGRKSNVSKDPSLSDDLEGLVELVTRGTRSHRCDGRAKVCASWPRNCSIWDIGSPMSW